MKQHFKKVVFGILAITVLVSSLAIAVIGVEDAKTTKEQSVVENTNQTGITMHYKWEGDTPHLYYSNIDAEGTTSMSYPGVPMNEEGNGWYSYTIEDAKSADMVISIPSKGYETSTFNRTSGEYWYDENRGWFTENPDAEQVEQAEAAGGVVQVDTDAVQVAAKEGITLHFVSDWSSANIYYWNALPKDKETAWPGEAMEKDDKGYYTYTFSDVSKINLLFTNGSEQTEDLTLTTGEWWYINGTWSKYAPGEGPTPTPVVTVAPYTKSNDFRDETIYFLMTTRFYDGDPGNNVHCNGDAERGNGDDDPAWRGDFKGLIEKLDYIKALGFSAIWITPVVENRSDYDYHGYHAYDFSKVDSRYESPGVTYQTLINEAHKRGIKIIQDVVFNHTSNYGERNLLDIQGSTWEERKGNILKGVGDSENIYHHTNQAGSGDYDNYNAQTFTIANDCIDLETENPKVYNYLIDCYTNYINMGVDAFRIDTAKHISRLTFNSTFLPAFQKAGGEGFYMFGEVCTKGHNVWYREAPGISTCFYTWAETGKWADCWTTDLATNEGLVEAHYVENKDMNAQPTSDNVYLDGNNYHEPDYSKKSYMNVIDFQMHWSFENASKAYSTALGEDKYFNDSTWNVTYVDSHDYGPDYNQNCRYKEDEGTCAENFDLMFTFRGIPCLYYGSEVQFQKGLQIDGIPDWKSPLAKTGRAYFGDYIEGTVDVTDYATYSNAEGAIAETLSHPLALHVQRLNLIRRAVPALRKGQYSTENIQGNMAFKRRYTANGEDSFVCVSISGGATFNGLPGGEYVDVVSGDKQTVAEGGTLTIGDIEKSNMRVYVLQNDTAKMYGANGKIGKDGAYLK